MRLFNSKPLRLTCAVKPWFLAAKLIHVPSLYFAWCPDTLSHLSWSLLSCARLFHVEQQFYSDTYIHLNCEGINIWFENFYELSEKILENNNFKTTFDNINWVHIDFSSQVKLFPQPTCNLKTKCCFDALEGIQSSWPFSRRLCTNKKRAN